MANSGLQTFSVQRERINARGISVKVPGLPIKEDTAPAPLLSPSLWTYLQDYELSQRSESYNLMKQTLEEFEEFVKKQEITEITRMDLLKYKHWLG